MKGVRCGKGGKGCPDSLSPLPSLSSRSLVLYLREQEKRAVSAKKNRNKT